MINHIKSKCIIAICVLLGLSLSSCETKTLEKKAEEHKTIVSADDDVYKHWIWSRPSDKDTDEELAARYKKFHDSGVVGVFFESDSERHFRAAKAQGLQAHRWMWIMNRGDALKEHPEWAAVSRSGKNTADNPPYVNYYRWMCPSKPEVKEFLVSQVKDALSKDYVDGIHFDYVRYSDAVLAVNLWQLYGIKQTEELPDYDFCYCETCINEFNKKYNKDLKSIEYPQESLSWKEYRYNAVTGIVEELIGVANEANKPATAAVFPTPDVAKKLVRQDWTNWDLDAVFPMIYHGFYKEDVPWIGSAVNQGVKALNGKFPLYAGIYLPDFKSINEVEEGIVYALNNGADGISIFGELNDDINPILDLLAKYKVKPTATTKSNASSSN